MLTNAAPAASDGQKFCRHWSFQGGESPTSWFSSDRFRHADVTERQFCTARNRLSPASLAASAVLKLNLVSLQYRSIYRMSFKSEDLCLRCEGRRSHNRVIILRIPPRIQGDHAFQRIRGEVRRRTFDINCLSPIEWCRV